MKNPETISKIFNVFFHDSIIFDRRAYFCFGKKIKSIIFEGIFQKADFFSGGTRISI